MVEHYRPYFLIRKKKLYYDNNYFLRYFFYLPEVLGAMTSVLLIWALTGIFVYVAALRIRTGEYNIEPDMMMLVSGCGVVFNVILALVLHGCASDIG